MQLSKAIKIVEKYQRWRRGEDAKLDIYPGDITKALDALLFNSKHTDTEKCTRVEVIDEKGRSYTNWKPTNKVELQSQDEGRTLKVFISKNEVFQSNENDKSSIGEKVLNNTTYETGVIIDKSSIDFESYYVKWDNTNEITLEHIWNLTI